MHKNSLITLVTLKQKIHTKISTCNYLLYIYLARDLAYDKHNWMFAAYAVWKNTPEEVAIAKFFLNN
jgi:hypothetical protein